MYADNEHDLTVLDAETRDAAVVTLRMLADGTRLSVLWELRGGEQPVAELCRRLARPSPAVSQHLAKLRMAGLVSTRREGNQIFYRLPTSHVRQLVDDVVAHIQHVEESR